MTGDVHFAWYTDEWRKGLTELDIIRVDRENLAREHICCAIADKKGDNCVALKKPATLRKLETGEEARNAPTPFTTYGLFVDGRFLTNRILDEKAFHKLMDELDSLV